MFEPTQDKDGRDVTVRATGIGGDIGIHSWSKQWGHSATTPEQEAPTKSIFLTLENAKRVRDELDIEIAHLTQGVIVAQGVIVEQPPLGGRTRDL